MFRCLIIAFLASSLILSGCTTTYNRATGRNEFIFIPTAVEVSIGRILAGKISNQFKLSKDPEEINKVKRIGKRLTEVSDRRNIVYHFNVIKDDALNAFTSPGGYIYINSGVIKDTTDDELACVIGHEIGHVAARHIVKKLQAQIGYDILMNIAAREGGLGELQKAVSLSYNLIMLGYSRKDELLADRLGAKYAYKAGYDPYAMVSFLKKIKETKDRDMGLVFLRSHPYASQRIKMLEAEIPVIIERGKIRNSTIAQGQDERRITSASPGKRKGQRPLKVMCPKCRRIFPGSVKYCPYDGTRLQ